MLNIPYQHSPVMVPEVLGFLNLRSGGTYVDCTLGGGGHAQALLGKFKTCLPAGKVQNPNIKIIGFDQDGEAIAAAKQRLAGFKDIEYINDNFVNLKEHLKHKVDGFLFDLGVSSYQIDAAERGFSLQQDGPLDMRMDQGQELTAARIINHSSTEELEKIFQEYGEERFARRIARAVIGQRPFSTTFQLKAIIEKAIPTWKKRESVTRIFQALRIAVNAELDNLTAAVSDAVALLNPGGRIVVIAYHSLEDRIIKRAFRDFAKNAILGVLTKKPITPGKDEVAENPRARSAKLRAAEKL
jgi:16S rRNA (cytosine1402-N4)-methyltransferase